MSSSGLSASVHVLTFPLLLCFASPCFDEPEKESLISGTSLKPAQLCLLMGCALATPAGGETGLSLEVWKKKTLSTR